MSAQNPERRYCLHCDQRRFPSKANPEACSHCQRSFSTGRPTLTVRKDGER